MRLKKDLPEPLRSHTRHYRSHLIWYKLQGQPLSLNKSWLKNIVFKELVMNNYTKYKIKSLWGKYLRKDFTQTYPSYL